VSMGMMDFECPNEMKKFRHANLEDGNTPPDRVDQIGIGCDVADSKSNG